MTDQELAVAVVDHMFEADAFSRWLGLEIVAVEPGRVTLQMRVRGDMLNGFSCCHGGVTFSLADSALAFASNTRGRVTVSVENSISYPSRVVAGDLLTAIAMEESLRKKLAFYRVTVTRNGGEMVGVFRGTVYRTQRDWLELLRTKKAD